MAEGSDAPWGRGVPADRRAQALEYYRRGNVFFEQQQYSRALGEYRQAVKAWDHPGIRYNMAVCLIDLERPLEAFQNLERGLAFGPAPLGDELYARGQTFRKLLRGQLAELTVTCSLQGARVLVDGDRQVLCPGTLTAIVEPGVHQIVAQRDSFMTETSELDVAPGASVQLAIDPRPFDEVALARRWPAYVPWATAAAGIAVGASSTPLLVSANNDIKRRDELIEEASDGTPVAEPEGARDLRLSARRKRIAAGSLIALGGAAAVTGVVMAFMNRPRPVQSDREPQPVVAVVPTRAGPQLWLSIDF